MTGALPLILAWRPFLDPLDLHRVWFLLLAPLALGVALAYKAVRARDMNRYGREVGLMTFQIIGLMILLAAASFVIVELIARAME